LLFPTFFGYKLYRYWREELFPLTEYQQKCAGLGNGSNPLMAARISDIDVILENGGLNKPSCPHGIKLQQYLQKRARNAQ
jgi:hypothetical protein